MLVQGGEVVAPEAAVRGDPVVDALQATGFQRVDAALAVRADLDQAHLAQHAEVAGDGGLGEGRQAVDELARGALAFGQQAQQVPAVGFGDGLEDVHDVEHN